MNKTVIFRKIGGIIAEITEQYQYLAANPENINPLELELFIANSHFLSEHLAILKKLDNKTELLNEYNPIKQFPEKEEIIKLNDHPVEAEFSQPDPAVINQTEELRSMTDENKVADYWFKPMVSDSDASFNEVQVVENIPQNGDDKLPVDFSSITKTLEKKADEPSFDTLNMHPEKENSTGLNNLKPENVVTEPVADERVPTLNEILSAGKIVENVADKMSLNEDKDLKSMIKLNDKLMFVRDLFNGYSLAYSEAIELVNRSGNFEAADNFLKQNYAVKNKWSEKQNTVDQFYEVLSKRFS